MALRLRRSQEGFGLVELIIAMMVLAIGVLGVASAFISGMVTLRRANQIATATALADRQLERYRALTYCAIYLDSSSVPAGYWTGIAGLPVMSSTCPAQAPAEARTARQDLSGTDTPDGHLYRIDTYIVQTTPVTTPALSARPLKKVTVVVRDGQNLAKTLVREESTFECSLGKSSPTDCT
jgi:prepilin-type N-terminal cleavage/methylation domain-containing protein